MLGWKLDERITTSWLDQHIPRLSQHLGAIGLPPGMVLQSWLQSFFLNHLPFESATRIWDVLLLIGAHFAHVFAITLIQAKLAALLAATSPSAVFKLLAQPVDQVELDRLLIAATQLEPELATFYAQHRTELRQEVAMQVSQLFEQHYGMHLPLDQLPSGEAHHSLNNSCQVKEHVSPPATPISVKVIQVARLIP